MTHPQLSDAVEWLRRLVAFDTSPGNSNKPLVNMVSERLADSGIRGIQMDGGKDNTSFFATIGPESDGGVVLSGHTDVVSVADQKWTASPFELAQRDGKLFARGSCDMKGFLSCALAMAPVFASAKLTKPVHLAFSRDEEIACAGSEDMLKLISQTGMRPAMALIGEPTLMKIVAGHKTGLTMRTVFRGSPAHSSMPSAGVSAIPYAARFVGYLESVERQMQSQADSASPFHPPHGTINVGTMHGGSALNILAEQCVLEWHYRGMPQDDIEEFQAAADAYLQNELLPEMKQNGHPADIVSERTSWYPGLSPDDSPALDMAKALTDETTTESVSFGTEAGYFQRDGIPAVVIGPGNIDQAHKPDEFIEASQLEKCLHFLTALQSKLAQ